MTVRYYGGVLLLLLFLGCGTAGNHAPSPAENMIRDTLHVAQEVGELMGDSLYVFGEVTRVVPVSEGFAVLDVYSCRISFYDRNGQYLRHIGGRGEGPGEFLLPLDFAVLDHGRTAVVDLVGRRIDILSQSGELVRSLPTGGQMLPFSMGCIADSTFFVYYYSSRLSSEEINLGYQIELWNPQGLIGEAWSFRGDYCGDDFRFSPGYAECCPGYGGVLYTLMEDSDLNVFLACRDRTDSVLVSVPGTNIAADTSDTGYDEKHAWVSFTVGDTRVDLASEPLEVRPQAGALGVDTENRLWVRNGTVDDEEWFIFSPQGEHTGYGVIQGLPAGQRYRYSINHWGAAAWSPYTEDCPVFYILSSDTVQDGP